MARATKRVYVLTQCKRLLIVFGHYSTHRRSKGAHSEPRPVRTVKPPRNRAVIMGHRWEVRSCRRPRSSHTWPLTREMLTGVMLVGSLGAAGGVGAGVGRQVLKIENILKMTRMILRAKNLRCTHNTSSDPCLWCTRPGRPSPSAACSP